jgi:4'-phosphopantetheinyl transferase
MITDTNEQSGCSRSARVLLLPGQVHIWKVELDEPELLQAAQSTLSADERQRAERLRGEQQRARFTAARTALRRLLSIYSGQPAQELRFGYAPLGKPYLLENGAPSGLAFNISHSGGVMLAAFGRDCSIGIDLECEQALSEKDWIVRKYFSAADQRVYQNLPADRRAEAFLSAWTTREACGKAHGTGFSAHPQMAFFEPVEPSNPDNKKMIPRQALRHPSTPFDTLRQAQGSLRDRSGIAQGTAQGTTQGSSFHNELEFRKLGEYWLLRFRPQGAFTAAVAVKTEAKPRPFFRNFTPWQDQKPRKGQFDSFLELLSLKNANHKPVPGLVK